MGTVTSWELNAVYPPAEFDIRFPDRSMVMDERGGRRRLYAIQPGGVAREIMPHEYGAGHELLMNSRSGEAFGPRSRPWLSWPVLIALGVVGLGAAAMVAWLRRRSSPSGTGVDEGSAGR